MSGRHRPYPPTGKSLVASARISPRAPVESPADVYRHGRLPRLDRLFRPSASPAVAGASAPGVFPRQAGAGAISPPAAPGDRRPRDADRVLAADRGRDGAEL